MMFCIEGYQLMGSCFCHGSAVTWKYDYLWQMSVENDETGKIEWFKILLHFAFLLHFALYRVNAKCNKN